MRAKKTDSLWNNIENKNMLLLTDIPKGSCTTNIRLFNYVAAVSGKNTFTTECSGALTVHIDI